MRVRSLLVLIPVFSLLALACSDGQTLRSCSKICSDIETICEETREGCVDACEMIKESDELQLRQVDACVDAAESCVAAKQCSL